MAEYYRKKKSKTKKVPKKMPKRMDNPLDDYQRKTASKLGKQTMWYVKKEDFEKMQREQLVRCQKAIPGTDNAYRQDRNYMLLMLGVNLGCRTNTILEMTPRDFAGGCFRVKEHKTGKVQQFELRDNLYKLLLDYVKKYEYTRDEFIFRAHLSSPNKPLTRQTAWVFTSELAKDVGIDYIVGAYSLRKSFARWLYDECHDIFKVMRVLGHSSAVVTARYICLEEDEVMKIRASIEYGFDKFH
nr:MAG TPA: site specific tyrosine recombinase [Caudoviricetes sp.]